MNNISYVTTEDFIAQRQRTKIMFKDSSSVIKINAVKTAKPGYLIENALNGIALARQKCLERNLSFSKHSVIFSVPGAILYYGDLDYILSISIEDVISEMYALFKIYFLVTDDQIDWVE